MNQRYKELDSIRGIAALMVLLGHFLSVFPSLGRPIMYSTYGKIVNIFWDGSAAVIMFFLLSGFVLSLPFYSEGTPKYAHYLIKRFCRIYIPYFIIILFALAIVKILQSKIGTIDGLVGWGWKTKVTLHEFIDHIIFLKEFNSNAFLMVIWSLVHEMRISIIFPIVVFMIKRISWKLCIISALFLSGISYLLMVTIHTQYDNPISTNYFITLNYTSIFIIGALIAQKKNILINFFIRFKLNYLFFPIALFLFHYPWIPLMVPSKLFPNMNLVLYDILVDWFIAIGSGIFILIALSSFQVSKFLLLKPIRFLGKISYSLYLLHPVVLLTMVHILFKIIPNSVILMISFFISLFLSWASYMFIEKPSIRFGKYLIKTSIKSSNQRKKASA